MTAIRLETGPVIVTDGERAALDAILRHCHANADRNTPSPTLVGPHGEEMALPTSLVRILREVAYHLAHGRAVVVQPLNQELSLREAAALLRVSRAVLIERLEQGEIPFRTVGSRRRIQLGDLIAYKQRGAAHRKRAPAHRRQVGQDVGLDE